MPLRPWVILAALSVGRIAFGFQFQTIATLAPDLVPRFGLSYAQLGSMIGSYMLLGVFAALPLGLLGRRFGERWVLATGLALMTAGACYSAWDLAPTGITLGRTLAGLGAVAMIVLQNKIIAEWFTGARFMMAISVSVCAFPIGVGLAQLLLPGLLAAGGLGFALLSDAAPAVLSLLLFLAGYREPPHAPPTPRRFSLPTLRECKLLLIAGLGWTVYTSGFSGYTSYLPSSLTGRGYGLAVIGLAMTIATWGNVPATLFGGSLAARFGGLNIFLTGTISLAVGMLGSALAGWPIA
ncbi:MAG TPA: MFS transporter, partial [Rhodopila sp.]|nr:MFS transporter [Rhodopila sp.]